MLTNDTHETLEDQLEYIGERNILLALKFENGYDNLHEPESAGVRYERCAISSPWLRADTISSSLRTFSSPYVHDF